VASAGARRRRRRQGSGGNTDGGGKINKGRVGRWGGLRDSKSVNPSADDEAPPPQLLGGEIKLAGRQVGILSEYGENNKEINSLPMKAGMRGMVQGHKSHSHACIAQRSHKQNVRRGCGREFSLRKHT
jgi:hypothetical protein